MNHGAPMMPIPKPIFDSCDETSITITCKSVPGIDLEVQYKQVSPPDSTIKNWVHSSLIRGQDAKMREILPENVLVRVEGLQPRETYAIRLVERYSGDSFRAGGALTVDTQAYNWPWFHLLCERQRMCHA